MELGSESYADLTPDEQDAMWGAVMFRIGTLRKIAENGATEVVRESANTMLDALTSAATRLGIQRSAYYESEGRRGH